MYAEKGNAPCQLLQHLQRHAQTSPIQRLVCRSKAIRPRRFVHLGTQYNRRLDFAVVAAGALIAFNVLDGVQTRDGMFRLFWFAVLLEPTRRLWQEVDTDGENSGERDADADRDAPRR